MSKFLSVVFAFFFNDTATTEIYTLSLHDALPIFQRRAREEEPLALPQERLVATEVAPLRRDVVHADAVPHLARLERRSEEHTSELQSQSNLVCRLLLEKKKVHTK